MNRWVKTGVHKGRRFLRQKGKTGEKKKENGPTKSLRIKDKK